MPKSVSTLPPSSTLGWTASRRWLALAAGLVLSLGAVAPAQAQSSDVRLLLNRIDRLERDVQTLSRQVYRGEAPTGTAGAAAGDLSGSYATQVEVRLQELERQIQMLTGRLEELNFANQQLGSR
ncbi:MAG TPA: hypothetical protein VFO41_18205, partial [Alphaproteobacteria bacterium]|nr:hypothetical protein [Alphaproteobacteria bacterium]